MSTEDSFEEAIRNDREVILPMALKEENVEEVSRIMLGHAYNGISPNWVLDQSRVLILHSNTAIVKIAQQCLSHIARTSSSEVKRTDLLAILSSSKDYAALRGERGGVLEDIDIFKPRWPFIPAPMRMRLRRRKKYDLL